MAVELFIQHNSTIQFPVVEEGARLTLERKGTPGKLEFTVVKGPGLNFAEGDPVKLTVNGTAMFYGFVFKKKRDKGGTIDEIQAVEQAVFLILNTERYEWLIHSWDYGVELHNLIGKDVEYCIPEIERRVREALLQDDRITAVQNFEFTVNKKKVLTTFTVVSIFGEINAELGVEI